VAAKSLPPCDQGPDARAKRVLRRSGSALSSAGKNRSSMQLLLKKLNILVVLGS